MKSETSEIVGERRRREAKERDEETDGLMSVYMSTRPVIVTITDCVLSVVWSC